MTTHPADVVAVAHQTLMFNEAALKQLAALFNRIALPGLQPLLSLPNNPLDPNIAKLLAWLAETGILFEPKVEKSADQDLKDRISHDIDELYKPYGLSAEDLFATRKDETKASEFRTKLREVGPTLSPASTDVWAMFSAIQRMTVNITRLCALQLRNLDHLDAHAIVPSEFSSFEQEDDHPNQQDVIKIIVTALPVPASNVSWQEIIEYRKDPNSLNRFIDLRNWLGDTARGKLTSLEVEEKLEPVLKRFRKQVELHRIKTDTTTFEAFVVTTSNVLRSLFSYSGKMSPKGLCSIEHKKLTLLDGESTSEGSELAYVLQTRSLFAA